MEIAITRMSSKGQIVIPTEMRKDIREGEKLLLIKNDKQLIMKKASEMDKNLKEDLEFARRTEEAWRDIDAGRSKIYSKEEFLKRLKAL